MIMGLTNILCPYYQLLHIGTVQSTGELYSAPKIGVFLHWEAKQVSYLFMQSTRLFVMLTLPSSTLSAMLAQYVPRVNGECCRGCVFHKQLNLKLILDIVTHACCSIAHHYGFSNFWTNQNEASWQYGTCHDVASPWQAYRSQLYLTVTLQITV